MFLTLALSCTQPPTPAALPAVTKGAPRRRPFSLGLDLPVVIGAELDRDDDHDGWTERQGDCDDTTGAASRRMRETCNLVDDDCDGVVDDGCREDWIGSWDFREYHAVAGEVISAKWGVFWADAAGTEWCRIEGNLLVEGPGYRNCPDCEWDFHGRKSGAEWTGIGCDRIDIIYGFDLEPDWVATDAYSYGYATTAYEHWLWYDGRYVSARSGPSLLTNNSLGWGVMYTNHDPTGRHEVFGDGIGNDVTTRHLYEAYYLPDGYTLSPE